MQEHSPSSIASKSRKFDTPQQEAYLNLWRTYDRLRILEDSLFQKHGITAQQYNALRLLRGNQEAGIQTLDLARKLVSRAPDITRLLDKLEENGWIARDRPKENRRVVLVKITNAGLKLLKTIDPEVLQCGIQQLGHLPENDVQLLIKLLKEARNPHEDPESIWS